MDSSRWSCGTKTRALRGRDPRGPWRAFSIFSTQIYNFIAFSNDVAIHEDIKVMLLLLLINTRGKGRNQLQDEDHQIRYSASGPHPGGTCAESALSIIICGRNCLIKSKLKFIRNGHPIDPRLAWSIEGGSRSKPWEPLCLGPFSKTEQLLLPVLRVNHVHCLWPGDLKQVNDLGFELELERISQKKGTQCSLHSF